MEEGKESHSIKKFSYKDLVPFKVLLKRSNREL